MNYDLAEECQKLGIYSKIWDNDGFRFDSSSVKKLSDPLESQEIAIKRGFHDYNSYYRADVLRFFITKEACKDLGLLILSILFHNARNVSLSLTNSESQIRTIICKFDHETQSARIDNFIMKPHKFQYCQRTITKHPWEELRLSPEDLPQFFLTKLNGNIVTEEDWNSRDAVVITGCAEALIRLAELCLNISNPSNTVTEVVLENQLGFQGVGIGSAEVEFLLPGSIQFLQS